MCAVADNIKIRLTSLAYTQALHASLSPSTSYIPYAYAFTNIYTHIYNDVHPETCHIYTHSYNIIQYTQYNSIFIHIQDPDMYRPI